MPSLRDYRDRIASVKSTRKITAAMKMVAASKLRRTQEQAQNARAYAHGIAYMLARIVRNVTLNPASPRLLIGTGSENRHLLILVTADKGLCAGFNANVVRQIRSDIRDLLSQDKDVKIACIGRKGADALRRTYGKHIVRTLTGVTGKSHVEFTRAQEITHLILDNFDNNKFDVCTIYYSHFTSILTQTPDTTRLIPFDIKDLPKENEKRENSLDALTLDTPPTYIFEPNKRERLEDIVRRNIAIQVFHALLESAAGEQAARMTAMEGATKNAGDMIGALTLYYNRARQAHITKELIEIISGAEAAA